MCWPLQHDPPLTFSSSSSRNSRTCVAQPSFELSLLLLMFFSIKTGEWIIQSLVQRHWINALAATVTPVTFFNHA
jgi:hypothetical protein